jgi:hypothetical protein
MIQLCANVLMCGLVYRALELYPNQTSAYINGGLANRKLEQYVK